ncbi:hypothetical protein PG984_013699 [Apiospora sp. TS-2023a]
MSDPLSIAGSLAGLAQLTTSTFIAVFQYAKDVKNAKYNVAELAKEIRNLHGIIQNLYLLSTSLEQTNSPRPILQGSEIMLCTATLTRIEKKLDDASSAINAGGFRGGMQSLKWPFSKNETEDLFGELERHKSSVNTALAADTVDLLMKSLGLQKQLRAEVSSIQNGIEKLEKAQAQFVLDERRATVDEFFLRVNPMHALQTNIRLKQQDTGRWFHQSYELLNWITRPNSKLWLSGIPGSGKSVMCASLIERVTRDCSNPDLSGSAVCFFFCDYKIPESQGLVNILQVLALQLARQHPDAFDKLEEYMKKLQHGTFLPKEPESPALLELIPLMCEPFSRAFVIVDALDECGRHCADVVRGLKQLATNTSNMSIAVFSRNELMIRQELSESYTHMEIAAHTEDLELFVGAEMLRRLALARLAPTESKEIRNALVSKAQGMFHWVVCQLDYLQELGAVARKRALDELPPTLNETYDRILLGQITGTKNSFQRDLARKTLRCICSTGNKMTISELCIAVSIDPSKDFIEQSDIVDELEVLSACSSLIRKNSIRDCLELAHFSVKEYLQDVDPNGPLGEFNQSKETSSVWLASICVRYLTFKAFNRCTRNFPNGLLAVKQRREQYPFYVFAAGTWPTLHRPSGSTLPQASECLRLLFDPRRKAYLQNWFVEYLTNQKRFGGEHSNLQAAVAYVVRQDVTPLHVAASLGLHSVCSWLLGAGISVQARSQVGTALDCALSGPQAFLLDPAQAAEFWNDIASPEDVQLTVELLMKNEAHLAVASTDASFSLRALKLCLGSRSHLPIIPFIRTRRALCEDVIPLLRNERTCNGKNALLHDIFQEVLDVDAEAHEDDPQLSIVVSYVRTTIISMGDWDNYGHIGGSFTSLLIEDADFERYVGVAAAQNRADEMVNLIADARFPTLGVRANPLHVAARFGNPDIIRVLLSSGIDFISDIQGNRLTSPLLECTADKHLPALRLLLGAGFDHLELTSKDWPNVGYTFWHLAAADNAVNVLRTLFEAGDQQLEALRALTPDGRTPLAEAVEKENLEAALLILNECPSGARAYYESNQPLLQLAARLGSDVLYQGLLEKGVTAGIEPLDGSTPLHHISWRVELNLLRRLLSMHEDSKRAGGQKVAELFLLHLKSKFTTSYRHQICTVEQQVFNTLFEGTLGQVEADENNAPIWEFFCRSIIDTPYPKALKGQGVDAIFLGKSVILPAIRAMTAGTSNVLSDYVAYRHQPAAIPVFQALVKLHAYDFRETWVYEVVKIILEVSGDPTCYRDSPSAITLLKTAAKHSHMRIIHILIEKGWDVLQREGLLCALEVACHFSRPEVFEAILNSTNHHRLTETAAILDLDLVESSMAGIASDIIPKTKHLLIKGLDPVNTTTRGNKYPWIVAAADENHFDVVTVLQEYGADLLAQGPDGMDVAKAAAFHGNMDMLWKVYMAAANHPEKYDWNSRK